MEFKEFVETHALEVSKAFERGKTYKYEDLQIGTKLIMLRPGFGGGGGDIRFITKINNDYITLSNNTDGSGGTYLLYKEDPCWQHEGQPWWMFCYILEDDAYEYLSQKGKDSYILDKTGYKFM